MINNQKMAYTLNQLQLGEQGIIDTFSDEQAGCKLMTMGILPGSKVKIVRKSPLGGAIYLKMNHQQFAIRNKEAECIMLK